MLVIDDTNRADNLDPSLQRVGRSDHEICLGIPGRAHRKILALATRANLLAIKKIQSKHTLMKNATQIDKPNRYRAAVSCHKNISMTMNKMENAIDPMVHIKCIEISRKSKSIRCFATCKHRVK